MKFALAVSCLAASASAFAPTTTSRVASAKTALAADLNGWVPDESKFCYGLPGSLAPVGEFDPLGFTEGADLDKIKSYREAELQHGRVAMLAVIGFLVTEAPVEYHPLFETGSKDIGPAIRHLDEVRAVVPTFFEFLTIFIGAIELNRALVGWTAPSQVYDTGLQLKEEYYPGDVGFDPFGLKPSDPEEFATIQTKELQNGRLAMLGIAGFVAQELTNGKEILVNLGLAPDDFDPSSLPVPDPSPYLS
uniref:Plastid light harvesting protein n=1 Tax=Amphora coffeiformis TaxID=265554 RepID=A0A7S3P3S7_9STRA